jgi:hypothetical protein
VCVVYIAPLVLPTTGIIPNKLRDSSKLLNLCPGLYNVIQKAVTLNTCCVFHMFSALIRRMTFLKRPINELVYVNVICDIQTRTLKCMCWVLEKLGHAVPSGRFVRIMNKKCLVIVQFSLKPTEMTVN